MGLIKAAKDAISTMMADQWREYFYCDSLSNDVLVVKGQKRFTEGRNSNTKGIDNIISNGSIIAVNEGQCMIIVDQGGIVEFCADAGEFVYDASTEPSLLYGSLGENVKNTFIGMGRRFTFGGNTAKDQRVYFFNIKEIMSNLFGTANPIPFRVVDQNIGLDMDIAIRCNGEYSFKLVDPLLFYKNVCGNVVDSYKRSEMASQMKSELMTALQPAFAKISAMGVRYSEIPAHSLELARAVNEELSSLWSELRGIEIVTLNINSVKASEEDEKTIKELQKTAVFRNAGMAAANLSTAQAEAMKLAAANTSTGPMMAFAGMNMANMVGGMNANQLFQMDAQNQAAAQQMQMNAQAMNGMNAGAMGGMNGGMAGAAVNNQTQAPILGWTCSCGQTDNRGKFCTNCGSQKPSEAGDKCGWEPEDPANPPKFCPECGDVFDDNDRK